MTPSSLKPECRWRQSLIEGEKYGCSSEKLITKGVTLSFCEKCPYRDHEPLSQKIPQGPFKKTIKLPPELVKRIREKKEAEFKGPGTELLKLLTTMNVSAKPECGCKTYARRMDLWGAEGCRSRKAEIVAHLKENLSQYGWREILTAGMSALWNGLPLTLEGMVDEAIRRAKENV